MRIQFAALLSAPLMASLSAVLIGYSLPSRAEVKTLDTSKAAMATGSFLVIYDIYKVQSNKAQLAEAKARLASSQAYKDFVSAHRAYNDLSIEKESLFGDQKTAAVKRLEELEAKRTTAMGQMMKRDILRFNPLNDEAKLSARLESSRAKMLAKFEEEQRQMRTISRVRRLGGLSLLVGGSVFTYFTFSELSADLSPAKILGMLPARARAQIANELDYYDSSPAPRTLEEIFRDHP